MKIGKVRLRWPWRVSQRIHGVNGSASGSGLAARQEYWTPRPVDHVDQIPDDELASDCICREYGVPRRLCEDCAPAFFGIPSGGDEQGVGLHGGDMCAHCGYSPPNARYMAIQEMAGVLYRAQCAGASPADLRAITAAALNEGGEMVAELVNDIGYEVADTWPATW